MAGVDDFRWLAIIPLGEGCPASAYEAQANLLRELPERERLAGTVGGQFCVFTHTEEQALMAAHVLGPHAVIAHICHVSATIRPQDA
jgi:hypothetical protein